jgi:uncharacterized protein (DUF427 family)
MGRPLHNPSRPNYHADVNQLGVQNMDDLTKLAGPAPGFVKFPDYEVTVEPAGARIRVMLGGTAIADSANALVQLETDHKAVYYFPREDVRMGLLEATDHDSF